MGEHGPEADPAARDEHGELQAVRDIRLERHSA